MASNKHKTAKRKRDTASKERESLVKERKDARKGGASKADIAKITSKIMNKSGEMRIAGDTMREETGREKGQRTTYTGPAKQATIDLIKKTTGQTLPEETKWQQVNAAWQNELMKNEKLTRAQARTKLKTLFAKNRSRYLKEQQQRYDDNIVAKVVDDDDEIIDDGRVKIGGKGGLTRATGVGATGLGGLMMETDPYRRAAPLDWSDIMPQDTPLQSQQEIISGGGKYYQPWATRQDTPLSLINYDKPRGNIPAVSFIPPGTQVTADYSGDQSGTDDNGGTKDYGGHDNYHDWYMDPANQFGHYWAMVNSGSKDYVQEGGRWVYRPGAGDATARAAAVAKSPGSGYQQMDTGAEDINRWAVQRPTAAQDAAYLANLTANAQASNQQAMNTISSLGGGSQWGPTLAQGLIAPATTTPANTAAGLINPETAADIFGVTIR